MKNPLPDLTGSLENLHLADALRLVAQSFPRKVVFSSSFGQEDMVLTDVIFKNNIPIEIFTLDTGRLFQETYDLWIRKKKNPLYKHIIINTIWGFQGGVEN